MPSLAPLTSLTLQTGRDKDRFGHTRLRDVLRRVTFDPVFQKSSYSAQFSSLGSLDEAWVNSEFLDSMAAEKGAHCITCPQHCNVDLATGVVCMPLLAAWHLDHEISKASGIEDEGHACRARQLDAVWGQTGQAAADLADCGGGAE